MGIDFSFNGINGVTGEHLLRDVVAEPIPSLFMAPDRL